MQKRNMVMLRFCIPYSTSGRSFLHFGIPHSTFERLFSLFFSSLQKSPFVQAIVGCSTSLVLQKSPCVQPIMGCAKKAIAKMVQDGTKMGQDGAKMAQDGAKMGQDGCDCRNSSVFFVRKIHLCSRGPPRIFFP